MSNSIATLAQVQTCPDCGNHDMHVQVVDGAAVHECGMCGSRFGDRAAVDALTDADEAAQRGVEAAVWPLVRALGRLPGLVVRKSTVGDVAERELPFVELGATSPEALVQLENLAKSLRLGAGALRLHWIIEVEYQQHLAFVLKPRHPGGPVTAAEAQFAQADLALLRRQLERDLRLGWWQHARADGNG